MYKKLIADQSKPASSRRLITKERVILGDSAFANCEWLLCPYDAPATRHQTFYHYKHSGTRFVVEHAFGRLKWKFMVMKNRMFFDLDSVPDIIVCCVALYNFILLQEGIGRGEAFTDDVPTISGHDRSSVVHAGSGSSITTARARAEQQMADELFLVSWGAPGSRLDRARQRAESRRARRQRAAGGMNTQLPAPTIVI